VKKLNADGLVRKVGMICAIIFLVFIMVVMNGCATFEKHQAWYEEQQMKRELKEAAKQPIPNDVRVSSWWSTNHCVIASFFTTPYIGHMPMDKVAWIIDRQDNPKKVSLVTSSAIRLEEKVVLNDPEAEKLDKETGFGHLNKMTTPEEIAALEKMAKRLNAGAIIHLTPVALVTQPKVYNDGLPPGALVIYPHEGDSVWEVRDGLQRVKHNGRVFIVKVPGPGWKTIVADYEMYVAKAHHLGAKDGQMVTLTVILQAKKSWLEGNNLSTTQDFASWAMSTWVVEKFGGPRFTPMPAIQEKLPIARDSGKNSVSAK
jgi:hypothetical protein